MNRTLALIAVLAGPWLACGPAAASEELVEHYECNGCHTGDEAIGPDYAAIAERYADEPEARAALIAVIRNGGKGNWPEVSRGIVMPPYYADMPDAEIAQVVDWILGL